MATIILVAVSVILAFGVSYLISNANPSFNKDSATRETAMISCLTYGFETNDPENIIVLNIRNNSTVILTITEALVNDLARDFSGKKVIEPGGESIIIIYSMGWVSGEEYHIVIKTDNKIVFRKSTTAP